MATPLFSIRSRAPSLTAALSSASAEAGQTAAEYAVLLGIICTMVIGAAAEIGPAVQERFEELTSLGVSRRNGEPRSTQRPTNPGPLATRITELVSADVHVVAYDTFTLDVEGTGEPWATRIELTNFSGNQRRHEARILANPARLPVEQVQLREGLPYLDGAGALVKLGPLAAGETEILTLTIPPGEYLLVCVVAEEGATHFERGMSGRFTVGTAP